MGTSTAAATGAWPMARGLPGSAALGLKSIDAGLVVVAFQELLHEREAGGGFVVDGVLVGGVDEADVALAGFLGADERAGDFLFGEALGLFLAGAAIHQDGDVAAVAGGFGLLRLLHRVDEFDFELGGEGGVAVQQVARLREAGGFVEVSELDVVLEIADDLDGLVGEAELLVAGGIVTLVVAVGQEVDGARAPRGSPGCRCRRRPCTWSVWI